MLLAIATLFIATALPQAAPPQNCPADITQNVWDPKFLPGQHWSYHNRSIDYGSTLTISKIDDVPGIGIVIHIWVNHLDFVDKPGSAGGHNFIDRFISIRRDSLDSSVNTLLGTVDIPDLPPHFYSSWQQDCRSLTASDTVADTLQAVHERIEAGKHSERKQQ
jgi:hypothetical protein